MYIFAIPHLAGKSDLHGRDPRSPSSNCMVFHARMIVYKQFRNPWGRLKQRTNICSTSGVRLRSMATSCIAQKILRSMTRSPWPTQNDGKQSSSGAQTWRSTSSSCPSFPNLVCNHRLHLVNVRAETSKTDLLDFAFVDQMRVGVVPSFG